MLSLIVWVAIVGVIVWLVRQSPLDTFFKNAIYALCVIWLILVLARLAGVIHVPMLI